MSPAAELVRRTWKTVLAVHTAMKPMGAKIENSAVIEVNDFPTTTHPHDAAFTGKHPACFPSSVIVLVLHARASTGKLRYMGPSSPRDPSWPSRNLVQRKCRVCEWEGEQVELAGADPDCPWCHGPTEALQVLPLPGGITVSGIPHAKNPFASALGRLGAKKGGDARARALSGKRRSEIARKAARARWAKAGKKR
jgi:hypothetical protein